MTNIKEILKRIHKDCEVRGCSPSTWGRHAVNDGKLVGKLEGGKTITLRTLQKIEAFLPVEPVSEQPAE